MLNLVSVVRKYWGIFTAIAIVIFFYAPSLSFGYFADDFDFAVRMPQISLADVFTKNTDGTIGGGSWRPLTIFSYWLTMAHGQSEFFNHAVSLTIYVGVCVLFYVVARKLFPQADEGVIAAATALFGLMPIHVEPVIWVAARGDLIAAVLALGGLLAWLKNRPYLGLLLIALSLGAKEFWLLFGFVVCGFLPLTYSPKKRIKLAVFYAAITSAWFAIRYAITHFGVGGYSVTEEQRVLGIQHLSNEVISFTLGSWNFGDFQSWIIRFSQYYWFIIFWILAGVCAYVARTCYKNERARFLLASLIAVFLPILALAVPFIRPGPSLAEYRYWFAPSIFLMLLATHYITRIKKTIGYTILFCTLSLYGYGTWYNSNLYKGAAAYEAKVFSEWSRVVGSDAIYTQVALLPDSWYGVHLLASPFFERALEYKKLPRPQGVIAWYQHCTVVCEQPLRIDVDKKGSTVSVVAHDPQIFSGSSRGLRYDTKLAEPRAGSLAIWSGTTWIKLSSSHVENAKP